MAGSIPSRLTRSEGGRYPANEVIPFRPEIVEAVGPLARRLLDLGCGEGGLARALPGTAVVGVEADPEKAARAREACERVHVLDLDREDIPEPDGVFDTLVFADVLEHLQDPWGALVRHRRLLAEGGRLVVSVPNAQHWRVALGLLAGRWAYRDPDGFGHVLARDHLRFFTRREIVSALAGAGYAVDSVRPVASRLALALSPGPLSGLAAFQLVAVAHPVRAS